MPAISRPVCSVNRYGFWMGQAGNSDYPKNTKLGIWYAPLGARHGVLVRRTNDWVLGFVSRGRLRRGEGRDAARVKGRHEQLPLAVHTGPALAGYASTARRVGNRDRRLDP